MQYPHFLYRLNSNEAIQDERGSWITTEGDWMLICQCREETNGKGGKTILSDGKDFLFHSLIQIPAGNNKIMEGTKIIITNNEINPDDLKTQSMIDEYKANGVIRIEGECMKYDINSFHNRMWM